MIKYINGDIQYIGEDFIILDNNGIGYHIFTSSKSIINFELNRNYLVYVYMAVREDAIDLYGFYDKKELEFFELLITVSSIGPKNALSILSSLDIGLIKKAINNNDIGLLTQAKGVGKKTASRIILELSDKIAKMDDELGEDVSRDLTFSEEINAAIEALTKLGYPRPEVRRVMNTVDTEDRDIEDIIKDCILLLSNS